MLTVALAVAACGPSALESSDPSITTAAPQATTTEPPTTAPPATTTPATTTAPAPEPLTTVPLPPEGTLYHGTYPGGITGEESDLTLADLRSYETAAGKTASWVFFSHNWYEGRAFPLDTAEWIREAGSIPYIRLMLRSTAEQDLAEPVFTLQAILDGEFDADLSAWCDSARDFGSPLLAEYGTEVNGEWFSWNGVWNGAGQTDGYGDPLQADGPERFRDVYRHIVQTCRNRGAANLTWVFHVNGDDWPVNEWNVLENYYPGDEWIDWIAISSYAGQTPLDDWWPSFRSGMDAAYPRVEALTADKPIIVAEFGAAAHNPLGDQAEWAEAALTDITSFRWPRVIGFSWWNEQWQNDDDPAHDTTMRLQDDPDLTNVFRRLVGDNAAVLGEQLTDLPEAWQADGRLSSFPIQPPHAAAFSGAHHDYPATDIFAPTGTTVVAVTDGIVDELRRDDPWDPAVDDPVTRGGRYVSVVGDDGVRYYCSHLESVASDIEESGRVAAGQVIGTIGTSGNAARTSPHCHFGISHPTFPGDWEVRRGEIWPYDYLLAWRDGEDVTPVLPGR